MTGFQELTETEIKYWCTSKCTTTKTKDILSIYIPVQIIYADCMMP